MLFKLTCITTIVTCFTFSFTWSLLKLGAQLLLLAFLSTLTVSFMLGSWFGLILFLVYITGLLVLFGYMLAVSPNSFTKDTFHKLWNTPLFVGLMLMCLFSSLSVNTSSLSGKSLFSLDVVKIFSHYNLSVYWLSGILLFVALVMAVLISYKSPQPLRPFMK